MHLGWAGLFKTVALTATLTSAAWVGLGVWWSQRQSEAPVSLAPERPQAAPGSASSETARDLVIPVDGVRPEQLTDTFTQARSGGRVHDAIDIMAPRGTPVIAAAAGRVEKLFLSKAGGNTVYVRTEGGRTIHYYAHLDSYARGLSEGLSIGQRDPLGTVGSTGNANPDAPHLHFEVIATDPARKWWEPGRSVNPYPLLRGR
jgi:murein DD-endopeptidase MepM/ murein hydrolase activator NlpD